MHSLQLIWIELTWRAEAKVWSLVLLPQALGKYVVLFYYIYLMLIYDMLIYTYTILIKVFPLKLCRLNGIIICAHPVFQYLAEFETAMHKRPLLLLPHARVELSRQRQGWVLFGGVLFSSPYFVCRCPLIRMGNKIQKKPRVHHHYQLTYSHAAVRCKTTHIVPEWKYVCTSSYNRDINTSRIFCWNNLPEQVMWKALEIFRATYTYWAFILMKRYSKFI